MGYQNILRQIVGGVTPNPITVPYTSITPPVLILRNLDGSNYAGAVDNVDTGTAIILTGNANASGKFIDTFNFTVFVNNNTSGPPVPPGNNIITKSDFITTIKIANKSDAAVNEDLTNFITEFEPEFLCQLFGETFASLFVTGIMNGDQRFLDLLTPQLRKAIATFIFFHYIRDNYQQMVGVGVAESKAQNATIVSPRNKLWTTWFAMVNECWNVQKLLSDDAGVIYPEWVVPVWYRVFAIQWLIWNWGIGIFDTPYYFGFRRYYKIPDIYYPLSRL